MDGCSWAISGCGFVWLMLTGPQVCLLHLPEQVWNRWKGIFPGGWDIASSVGQREKGREGVHKESGVRWDKQGALAGSSVFRCICLQLPGIVF